MLNLILFAVLVTYNPASATTNDKVDLAQNRSVLEKTREDKQDSLIRGVEEEKNLDALTEEAPMLESQLRNCVGFTLAVGFSVSRSSTLHSVSYRSTVLWQHLVTNEGGAWNHNTGKFCAPINGLYAFHLTASTPPPDRWVTLPLMKNGWEVAKAHATGRTHAQGSTHVVLHLRRGDYVYVEITKDHSLFADYNTRPVFSGYLIAATS